MAILADLSKLSQTELVALVQRQQEALEAKRNQRLTLKVTPKGCLGVYGLGRYPVTLYRTQWERLLSEVPAIQAFLRDHVAELAVKED